MKLTTLSRMITRRRETAMEPPRPLWRVVGSLPILALAMLLVVQFSYAWFAGGAGVPGGTFASGTFESLMEPSPRTITLSGTEGDPLNAVVTVLSETDIGLPIKAAWEGSAPSPASITLSSPTISARGTVQVTVSGTYSTFTRNLVITIGSHDYDWGTILFNVTATPRHIDDIIDITTLTPIYRSGTGAPKFKALQVSLTGSGATSTQFDVSLTQTPNDGYPVTLHTTTITPTPAGVPIEISKARIIKGTPVNVTITISSPSYAGVLQACVVLAHEGDKWVQPCNPGDPPQTQQGLLLAPEAADLLEGADLIAPTPDGEVVPELTPETEPDGEIAPEPVLESAPAEAEATPETEPEAAPSPE